MVSKEIVQDVPKAIQFGPHLGDDFIIIGACICIYRERERVVFFVCVIYIYVCI